MTTRLALLIPLVTVGVLVATRSAGTEEPKRPESVVVRTAKSNGMTLTAKLKKEAAAGGPYFVTISVKNEGKKRVLLDEFGSYVFDITITDGEGKTVPYTRFGRKRLVARQKSGRGKTRSLKPGEPSASRLYNLARLFDLSEKGTYKATIRKKVHIDRGDFRPVAGGPVIIEITDLPLMLREPTRADHTKWR